MNQEPLSQLELIKRGAIKGREALEWLSQTGDYVYHGSSQRLDSLEPRQQKTWDYDQQVSVLDGEPAVCAANVYEPAIFRALINRYFDLSNSHWSGWGGNGATIQYRATQTALDGASKEGVTGYVHVFRKEQFAPYRGMECRTNEVIIPELVVAVSAKDLPPNIEIVLPKSR